MPFLKRLTLRNICWLWGMRAIDEFLNDFQLNLVEKLNLMEKLKDAFGREFGMNISLKQQLDKKYGENRPIIEDFCAMKIPKVCFFLWRKY